jgi:hypothetical protein
LLTQARRRADRAGHLRFALLAESGGRNGSNLWTAVIRERFAAQGLDLHNDLQDEHAIVGNFQVVLALRDFGSSAQREEPIHGILEERQHRVRPDGAGTRLGRHAHGNARGTQGVGRSAGLVHRRGEDVDDGNAHGNPLHAVCPYRPQ